MSGITWDSQFILAALVGMSFGLGVVLILAGLPGSNRPRFLERVAPYLGTAAVAAPGDGTPRTVWASMGRLFVPVLEVAFTQLDRLSVDSTRLANRLRQAGLTLTVPQYRVQQLITAAAAASVAAAAAGVLALTGSGMNLLLGIACTVAAGVLGVALRDQWLSMRVNRRRGRLLIEFPTIAELLALSVSAGETVQGAFDRISRTTRGDLAGEFATTMSQVRTGESFSEALRQMSSRIEVPHIARFLDGVVVAVERGTPLADVLRSQAADAREVTTRELMESAGRREIGMLAPVVFGILPLTVLFAIFPGLSLLNIGL